MARGNHADSTDRDGQPDSRSGADDEDRVDPLKVAFDGLEDADDVGPRLSNAADLSFTTPAEDAPAQRPTKDFIFDDDRVDPLAMLSQSLDDQEAAEEAWGDDLIVPDIALQDPVEPFVPFIAPRPVPPQDEFPGDLPADDLPADDLTAEPAPEQTPEPVVEADRPRVTTWADDVADEGLTLEPWATGEFQAVRDVPEPPAVEAVQPAPKTRGRRKKNETAATLEPTPPAVKRGKRSS
ncbi:MAG: hypothetical protein JWP74_3236, partial [Marmoricola sp.]|nr:hypothetical protein [Marmoricola sp.]